MTCTCTVHAATCVACPTPCYQGKAYAEKVEDGLAPDEGILCHLLEATCGSDCSCT